ncbi:hypothetical protein V8F33_000085 [Rhypophila sp. PSN 637]
MSPLSVSRAGYYFRQATNTFRNKNCAPDADPSSPYFTSLGYKQTPAQHRDITGTIAASGLQLTRSMALENPRDQQDMDHNSSLSQNGASASNGTSQSSPASSTSVTNHLTQALRDLARGETAAAALEANLTALETKLDDILASLGVEIGDLDDEAGEDQEDGDKAAAKKDDAVAATTQEGASGAGSKDTTTTK